MKTIGVRELRQRASEYLREVEEGASLEVTAHGRGPVAQLVPVRPAARRAVLLARGRTTPADGDVLDLGTPMPADRGERQPSALLIHARNDER